MWYIECGSMYTQGYPRKMRWYPWVTIQEPFWTSLYTKVNFRMMGSELPNGLQTAHFGVLVNFYFYEKVHFYFDGATELSDRC
jgi:hypothetical protein